MKNAKEAGMRGRYRGVGRVLRRVRVGREICAAVHDVERLRGGPGGGEVRPGVVRRG